MKVFKIILVFLVYQLRGNIFYSGRSAKVLGLTGLAFIQAFYLKALAIDDNRASQIIQLCGVCHGSEGHGRKEILAPSIAGLPEWYLVNQLQKFRTGGRGAHPYDLTGLKMRPMARVLDIGSRKRNKVDGTWHYESDKELQAIAQYVSKLKPKQPKDAIEGGDPVKGKSIYLNCMGCHGQKAEGMVFMRAPSLVHVEGWYMLEQLKKFKSGQRGAEDISKYVPTDPLFLSATQTNAMRGIVEATIPNEQAMKDVIAYIREIARETNEQDRIISVPLSTRDEHGNPPAVSEENSTQP